METRKHQLWMRKTAIASILPFAGLGLVGCNSTSGTEEGTDVEDVAEEEADAVPIEQEPTEAEMLIAYDGVYGDDFVEGMDTYVGQEVVLSADVNEILTQDAFTIAGTDDTSVEALLVLHDKELQKLTPGLTVEVTGTVKESFDLASIEEKLGIALDDAAFEDWEGETYIKAGNVDMSVEADT